MANEKNTEELKLRLPETLHTDLMRLAAAEDRSLSDYVRHVLSRHAYGAARVRDEAEGR
jgi:predicted HicB family RNase H-like nuclease